MSSRAANSSLRLIWLEAFLFVVETGSFTEAAARMNVEQPDVTKYVRALAQWLGFPLFEGHGATELTKDARTFLPVAQRAHESLLRSRRPVLVNNCYSLTALPMAPYGVSFVASERPYLGPLDGEGAGEHINRELTPDLIKIRRTSAPTRKRQP